MRRDGSLHDYISQSASAKRENRPIAQFFPSPLTSRPVLAKMRWNDQNPMGLEGGTE